MQHFCLPVTEFDLLPIFSFNELFYNTSPANHDICASFIANSCLHYIRELATHESGGYIYVMTTPLKPATEIIPDFDSYPRMSIPRAQLIVSGVLIQRQQLDKFGVLAELDPVYAKMPGQTVARLLGDVRWKSSNEYSFSTILDIGISFLESNMFISMLGVTKMLAKPDNYCDKHLNVFLTHMLDPSLNLVFYVNDVYTFSFCTGLFNPISPNKRSPTLGRGLEL